MILGARLFGVALLTAVGAAACSPAAKEVVSAESGDPQGGGTAVIALEQEPPVLNPFLLAGLHNSTFAVVEPVLAGAYHLTADTTYVPDLITGDPEVQIDPFRLTYTIKPEANWDDGTPVSAEDFRFTWETAADPKNDIGDRTGYELIEDAEIVDDKTITFTFSAPFAPFKQLFSFVLPAHELAGENFNKAWSTEMSAASGPFRFEIWQGTELKLVRNEKYWGEHDAHLDGLTFTFIGDPNTQVQALRGDEVDVISPRPSESLVRLRDEENLTVESTLGLNWEHLAFQHDDPLIGELFVREAIAHAIDREQIVEELLRPLHPDAEVLNDLVFVTNQTAYSPAFSRWNFDPERAEEILEGQGCERGAGDIYRCDGKELSFGFTAASDDPTRELVFEVIQEQLRAVGVEVTPDFRDPNAVYSKVLPTDRWDMFSFAWTASGDPAGAVQIWGCEGGLNFLGYCDRALDRTMEGIDSLVDPTERVARYNQANELMSESLPALPLYQNPTFLIFDASLEGPQVNPTNSGPAWNAQEWHFTNP